MRQYIVADGFLMLLAGCAHQPADFAADDPPRLSPWHTARHDRAGGADCAPDYDTVRIYAVPNAGGWHDLGFMIAIGGISGAGLRA